MTHVVTPLVAAALLIGLLSIHLLLATPRTALRTTSRPYVLVTAASLVIFGFIKLFVATLLDLISYAYALEHIWYARALQAIVEILLLALSFWYIWKQTVYLKATYSRSGVRTFSAVLIGQVTVLATVAIIGLVLSLLVEPYVRDYFAQVVTDTRRGASPSTSPSCPSCSAGHRRKARRDEVAAADFTIVIPEVSLQMHYLTSNGPIRDISGTPLGFLRAGLTCKPSTRRKSQRIVSWLAREMNFQRPSCVRFPGVPVYIVRIRSAVARRPDLRRLTSLV
jgi:hypothetical protein